MADFSEGAAGLSSAAAMLLGWRPNEFWDATPAELSRALQMPGEQDEAPDKATIDALRLRFPDGEMKHG